MRFNNTHVRNKVDKTMHALVYFCKKNYRKDKLEINDSVPYRGRSGTGWRGGSDTSLSTPFCIVLIFGTMLVFLHIQKLNQQHFITFDLFQK